MLGPRSKRTQSHERRNHGKPRREHVTRHNPPSVSPRARNEAKRSEHTLGGPARAQRSEHVQPHTRLNPRGHQKARVARGDLGGACPAGVIAVRPQRRVLHQRPGTFRKHVSGYQNKWQEQNRGVATPAADHNLTERKAGWCKHVLGSSLQPVESRARTETSSSSVANRTSVIRNVTTARVFPEAVKNSTS